jgi:hypothetical protein
VDLTPAQAAAAGPPQEGPSQEGPSLTDAQLDQYVLLRLQSLGVDLSVLPEDDPDAPADQHRILRSARRFLRSTPPDILAFEMDPQAVAPAMYPAETARRTRRGEP